MRSCSRCQQSSVFRLHPLPPGEFSLLEITIVMAVPGYGLSSALGLDVRAWAADAIGLVSPPEIALPALALVALACLSLLTVADPAHRHESARALRTVIADPVLFLLLARRDARIWATGCMVVAGVNVRVLFVALVPFRSHLFDLGGSGGESTHFAVWRSAIRMINDHPITGVGLDQFLDQYGRRYIESAAWGERYTSHAHNLILDIWLSLGVVGLAVGAWIAAGVAREVWRVRKVTAQDGLAAGAFGAHGRFGARHGRQWLLPARSGRAHPDLRCHAPHRPPER